MPISVSQGAREAAVLSSLGNGLNYGAVFGNEDKANPMHCGLFTVTGGEATAFLYPATEFVIVLEGQFRLQDVTKGEEVIAKAGDVVRVDKGTTAKWSSPSQGKGFYVSQVAHDEDLAKHIV